MWISLIWKVNLPTKVWSNSDELGDADSSTFGNDFIRLVAIIRASNWYNFIVDGALSKLTPLCTKLTHDHSIQQVYLLFIMFSLFYLKASTLLQRLRLPLIW